MRPIHGLRTKRGQSLVEFALILPVMMLLLLGMVEMGFAINHNVSIQTATRQGARVGSVLVNGDTKCATGDAVKAATVDPGIIAAVEGALTSTGSSVDMSQVTSVEIFGVSSNNAVLGTDKYKYDSVSKHFIPNGASGWPAVGRCGAVTGALPNGGAPRIGVKITYNYKFLTPLGSFLNNNGQITMTDQTTMALEPPKP
jgi:hypothetical protein